MALAGDRAEPLVALGYYYYWGRRDYERALATFEKAAAGRLPSADVLAAVSYIKRRQGLWDESIAELEAAQRLDPANDDILGNLWESYIRTRDFEKAEGICPRMAAAGEEMRALCRVRILAATGAFDAAESLMKSVEKSDFPFVNTARYWLATIGGRHEEALRWASLMEPDPEGPPPELMAAWSNHYLGRKDEARRIFEKVAAAMNERLKKGQDPQARQSLSQAYAGLGRKEDALREATLAADMVSLTRDAFEGPDYLENLAEINAFFGEKERALDLIDQVLDVPSELTVPVVERVPVYAVLRDHPRYQEILRKHR
jgi:serine/threonine-protein kinase